MSSQKHQSGMLVSLIFTCILLTLSPFSIAQDKIESEDPDYPVSQYKPLILDVSEDGSKYIRFIIWNQIWAEDHNLDADPGFKMRIRRARLLAYAQISPRFMVLTHFGLNNLTSETMDPLGNGLTMEETKDGPQLFLHAAWTEFKVSQNEALYMGAGLHYWNGLSRMTSASTLNFMTMDNHRQAWAQLGLSNQFARHLGVYAKGQLGRFNYTFSVNDPITNALGSDDLENLSEGSITYSGKRVFGSSASTVLTGRLEFQMLDRESNKLPYRVGTYMGKKKVFNVGAGFFNHKNGTVTIENGAIGNDVNHFALDVYYDAPIGEGGINAYAAYYNFNYGENYTLGTTYGTGNSVYAQVGYLFPFNTRQGRFMPYAAFSTKNFEAFDNSGNLMQLGANWFINGHNAKLTLEYRNYLNNYNESEGKPDRIHGLILQTHIFL